MTGRDLDFFFFIRLGNIIYLIKINLVTRGMLKAIYRLFTERMGGTESVPSIYSRDTKPWSHPCIQAPSHLPSEGEWKGLIQMPGSFKMGTRGPWKMQG